MSGAVSQMFEQALDVTKGWFHLHALDKSAKLDNDLLTGSTAVPAGRVAHLNSVGEFELGASGNEVPIFLWNGKDHPDVYNNGVSPTTGVQHWIGISPTGVMSGLVAMGAYELQTTEFDSDQTYAPNDPLTCDANGVLTNQSAVPYTDLIVGFCSAHVNEDNQQATPANGNPVGYNSHGVQVLTFWPHFLPEAP